jgi:hypothetical protein
MRIVPLICAVFMLAACVTDTMQKYVGRDIREVELNYGPPSNQIDLSGGTRAFQWTKISVDTAPVTATSTTEKTKKGGKITQTNFSGGDQSISKCIYTFLTTWDGRRGSWIVTGIKQPSWDCSIGDLS